MSLDQDEIRTLAVRTTGRAMRQIERLKRRQNRWRFGVQIFWLALNEAWWFWIEPHIHQHNLLFAIGGAVVLWLLLFVVWFTVDRVLEAKWRGWKRHTDDLWDRYEQARKRP